MAQKSDLDDLIWELRKRLGRAPTEDEVYDLLMNNLADTYTQTPPEASNA